MVHVSAVEAMANANRRRSNKGLNKEPLRVPRHIFIAYTRRLAMAQDCRMSNSSNPLIGLLRFDVSSELC